MDYKNPDYNQILISRSEKLKLLRSDKKLLAAAKMHYKQNPWDFIKDWGMTFDPRNIERGLPASIPFIPFPKQIEFIKWLHERWLNGERGLNEKSRDFGATWLAVAYASTMFLFYPGFTAGFGSRKQDLVDKKGDPKCIFEKARFFLDNLPAEFKPEGYDGKQHATFLKITNPENSSTITGEAGDDIGRGARMSIYFVDESAFLPRQDIVDAALSQTTNCQIDISTPNGNGNLFFKKRHGNKIPVFTMRWKDDPRKDQAWYDKQVQEQDEVTVAQEIDIDYNASVENVFIPAKWAAALLDAHKKLGFDPVGVDVVSFDPADTGDARARGHRKGRVLLAADSRKDGDITDAMPWAFELADDVKADVFVYDADGMGAPSMKLYLNGATEGKKMTILPFHGSGEKHNPDAEYKETGKTNKDKFKNRRAQAWMNIRDAAEKTYQAIEKGVYTNPDEMMSISSDCKNAQQIINELSRPMRKYDTSGRIQVESKEDMRGRGVESPNDADMFVMAFDEGSLPKVKKKRRKLNYQTTSIA